MKNPQLIFDMNETLLDLKKLRDSVSNTLKGGPETVSLWFETMLHYSLVSTVTDCYSNFGDIGAAALVMLAKKQHQNMSMDEARRALKPIRQARAYPDVSPALEQFAAEGFSMAILTNSSQDTMQAQLQHAGLSRFFERCLSVESLGQFKPHRHAYRWAARKLKKRPGDCVFVAAHGWDVAGAMAAGMDAAFISRPGHVLYPLSADPSFIAPDLTTFFNKIVEKSGRSES